MRKYSNIILLSLVLTVIIFAAGILLNYGLDFIRIDVISDVMLEHELSTQAYVVEQEFISFFGGSRCDVMATRIASLKDEIRKVGADLGSYSKFSFFKKKDFDYLKRKYFLLQMRFLSYVEELNEECGQSIVPIIFFYEIDQMDSERQGFILQEVSKDFEDSVIVINLDKDYNDEPLVGLLAMRFNVTSAPAVIVNGFKREGMVYEKELDAILREKLGKTAAVYEEE